MLTGVNASTGNLRARLVGVVVGLGTLALAASLASGQTKSVSKATSTATATSATATAATAAKGPATAATKTAPDPAKFGLDSDGGERLTAVASASAPAAALAAAPGAVSATTTRDASGNIEIHVKNEDLSNVLEMLSREYKLNIVATKGARGRISVDLYAMTLDQVLDAVCRGAGVSWSRDGTTIYVLTAEEAAASKASDTRLVSDLFVLNYLSADEASKDIVPLLSGRATVAMSTAPGKGLPTGADDTGGNSFGLQDVLVVRDFPENLDAVRKLLKKLDVKPRQVLVEATILKVTLNDDTTLGVNFNTLAGINFNALSNSGIPIANPLSVLNDPTNTVAAGKSPFGAVSTQGFAAPGKGLNIGIITNNVALFVNALEAVTDTHIIGNPKVLALNRQRAEVIVGDRFGYLTTEVSNSTTIQTVQFLETGTQLIFRPYISDDGHIRLEIHPKVSTGAVVGGLPNENTTEVTCNIMVRDGNTIVIGGLFDETASVGRSQVPGLGNIPFMGALFRSKEDSSVRHEVVILLTPHIIDDEEAYTELSEQQMSDAIRGCLGMREGFSCFTRERLLVAHMQEAEKAWKDYEKTHSQKALDKANWHVEIASNISPNDVKVLRLKDKVLSVRNGVPYTPPNWTLWDTLSARLGVYDKVAKEKAAVVPPPPGAQSSMEWILSKPQNVDKADEVSKAMAGSQEAGVAAKPEELKAPEKAPAAPALQTRPDSARAQDADMIPESALTPEAEKTPEDAKAPVAVKAPEQAKAPDVAKALRMANAEALLGEAMEALVGSLGSSVKTEPRAD
jgi:type IV pilus assembly protein PilQ